MAYLTEDLRSTERTKRESATFTEEFEMSRITVFAVLLALLFSLTATAALAGMLDGVTYESWAGWGNPANKDSIEFADFLVGDMHFFTDDPAEPGASISLHNASGEWSGLGFAYPTAGATVSCLGSVGYGVDFTLAFSQRDYFNPNVWYRTTISRQDNTGATVFSGRLIGDGRIFLAAGNYSFLSQATTVPEPSSLLAFATGIIGMGGLILRRRK